MIKQVLTFVFITCCFVAGTGQNWQTTGGSSQRNGISVSYGPEAVSTPYWSVANASSTMWGGAIFSAGDYFTTSRVKFSPTYHVIVECRKISDGSLAWDKEFPNDGKLYVVGMNEDAVYVHNYATDSLFAFKRETGEMKWVCPEKAMIFGGAHGILFACNGDPVVNGPDLYQKSLMRLDKYSGDPIWYNTNMTSVGPATDYCIFGDRLYRWEGAIGIPTHLVAVDLETGESLFYSEDLSGDPDQEHPLTAGPDGTIYGQRDGGDLWAMVDEGNSFGVKWFYSPENGGMGTYGNIGIGPDWSVYYPDGNVVKRLDPSNGQVLNATEPLSTDAMFGTYITTDDFGTVYISNAEAAEGKYFAFSADLQSKLWEKAVTYNYYAGPQISKDGIFIMAGNGTTLQAYKTDQPHNPVSWFEADQTHIPQNSVVTFTDMSSFGPDSWHWIFEGGSPQESFLQNPDPVYYLNPGIYSVTLITSNSLGADTLIRECYIEIDAVPGFNSVCKDKGFDIYPNPCDGSFHVLLPSVLNKPADCRIINICGIEEYRCQLSQMDNEIRSSLSEGIYLIRITLEDQVLSGMLFVR
jgi:PKD repeat protein